MIKTTTIVITSILAVLVICLFPKQTISPGDLSGGHKNLENDCMKCHTIFFGTPGEKCVFCHNPSDIGIVTTAGVKIETKSGQGKTAFHHLFSGDSCVSCHTDHSGSDINKSVRQFSHSLLINQCRTCHQGPIDNLHRHNSQECSQCHTTDRWRPATLDHAKYFRFDKHHGPDCLTCHRDNNFSEYTCYGCHEHSPGKIQEEHREEGIRNYQDCAACHPSSNEDEAKRIFRSGGYKNSSWKSFGRKDYNQRERYKRPGYTDEHYDDDRHDDDDSDSDDD